MKENIHSQVLVYFELWANKQIDELEKLFSDDIVLKDWTNKWFGKQEVVDANKEIFKNDIKLSVMKIDVSSNTAFCQIYINVNGETISVLDVIEFNDNNLIKKITAYKG